MADELLTYKQVGALTGLGKSEIYRRFAKGDLPGYKYGTRKGILFKRDGVEAFMTAHRNKTAAPPTPAPLPNRRRPPKSDSGPPMVFRFL